MNSRAESGAGVTVAARAKVNPLLRVLGRREDGNHELETLLLALDLSDRVTAKRGSGPGVRVLTRGPLASEDIVDGPGHLAVRGAQAALDQLGRDEPLDLVVEKHIPSRAGLGGGSSDAAAAALAVTELLLSDSAAPEERSAAFQQCGPSLAALGADCAFFGAGLEAGAAFATGRGDELRMLGTTPAWEILLITPAVTCATPAVYGALTDGERAGVPIGPAIAGELLASGAAQARTRFVNDLEPAAARVAPELTVWRELFGRQGLDHMLLSGSGSSFFGAFERGTGAAQRAMDGLQDGARGLGLSARLWALCEPAACALSILDGEGAGHHE